LGVEQFEDRVAGGAGVVFVLGQDALRVLCPPVAVFVRHWVSV
jgi:hypothetical protein